jgi:hypothetical protein
MKGNSSRAIIDGSPLAFVGLACPGKCIVGDKVMRGELIHVWKDSWQGIWEPLYDQADSPDDMFCELFSELSASLQSELSAEELADIIDNPVQSMDAFRCVRATDLAGEKALAKFFEQAHSILQEFGVEGLEERYFTLLDAFIAKYSLRYELRRPCSLHPTLPGIFANLVGELRSASAGDVHLATLMDELDDSFRDLHAGSTTGRIKTVIQKQFNLLEAMGRSCKGVTQTQLGGICGQIGTWPHAALGGSLARLYGFASDYPGIRHAGNPEAQLREVDLRDLLAILVVLTGFTPYLRDEFDPSLVFHGS